MLLPRRSLVLKTLAVVFIAALCLCIFLPPGHTLNGVPSPETSAVERIRSTEALTSTNEQPVASKVSETTDLSQFTFATLWGREKESSLAAFSTWATRYTNAAPNERSEMLPKGVELARERRTVFKNLIRTHPKAALAQAVPALVRNELPSAITSLLEERVSGTGDFVVLGRTDARDVQTVSRRAVINSQEYEAFVYGKRASQRSRANISMHGVAIDGEVALSDSPLRVFEEGEPVPAEKPLAADSCPVSQQPTAPTKNGPRPHAVAAESGSHVYWMCHGKHVAAAADQVAIEEIQFPFEAYANVGARSVLIMLVDFSDVPGAPATSSTVENTISAVDSFLNQNSYGDLHFGSHAVTSVLRMPRTTRAYGDPTSASGDSLLLNDARNAARTNGFNPDSFDFDVVAFVDIGFPWSGQGYIGSKGAWIQGNFAGGTLGHELGHNLGLWHANSWNSADSSISPNGWHEEYGNPFDVMGRSTTGFPNNHYSANFKRLLGWLAPGNIGVVNASGTYRVYAQDQNSRLPSRLYALSIPAGITAGDEFEDYWIDFRQLLATLYPSTSNGAIVQWGNDAGTKSASRLLDMNVATTSKSDAPLAVGRIFDDADRGLKIKPLAKGGTGPNSYLDVQITLVAPPIVDLAEAVDNANFTWNTSAAPWVGQRSVTHDGVDAAASAPIRDDSETYMESTINGPAALFFWWKVSSEESFDFLKLVVDDQELASISGQVDWEKRGYELAEGPHTVRWIYKKDGGTASGADRGWVDEVSYIAGEHAPFINSQSLAVTAGLGETAELRIDAIGSAPLSYQWYKINDLGEPVAITDATNATYIISNVQNTDAGEYNCVLSNPAGALTSSNVIVTVTHFVSIAESLDNEAIAWTSSGAVGWAGQQAVTHDGTDAAQSGAVSNGKESSLTATITGPGTLQFWWKISSEADYDLVSLYLDGDLVEYHSGEFDWTQTTLSIPNGKHLVRWTYSKDTNLSEGQDAAWVDEVTFTPIGDVAPQFINEPLPQLVSVGGSALFTATYSASTPTTFTWLKDGVPLEARPSLIGLGTDTLRITNVQTSDVGSYTLKIANDFGSITSAGAALTIVTRSLADALDQPKRAFLTGDAPWGAQTTVTHDMVDATRSGMIPDEQFTWIETRVQGPATVAFWWKVSSEQDYDFLQFELDTLSMLKISGQIDWRKETVTLEPGDHVLRWKYQKDRNTPGGDDGGWLDQLEITPIVTTLPELTNIKLGANSVSATVQSLPAAGLAVLECSTNLVNWNALSTNQITGATINIVRPTTNNAQFLRIRLQ